MALYANTTNSNGTAIGTYAMKNVYTGNYLSNTNFNVAVGYEALRGSNSPANNSGNYNTALGYQSLMVNSSGNSNTSIGIFSLNKNTTGFDNTSVGSSSLNNNTTGNENSALGVNSLTSNTTGYNNVAIGSYALNGNVSGNDNVGLGISAFTSNSTGSYLTSVGNSTNVNASNYTNSSAIGFATMISASNQIRLGSVGITSIGGQVGWSTLSDGRVKKNVQSNVPGLDFIMLLKPVTYNVDVNSVNKLLHVPEDAKYNIDMKSNKDKIVYSGFIAQDVELAAKKIGYDFSGVDAPKNEKDIYGLRYAEFTVPLVKAVQELADENKILKDKMALQESNITSLIQQIEILKGQVLIIKNEQR
jgi:hypothetical protein